MLWSSILPLEDVRRVPKDEASLLCLKWEAAHSTRRFFVCSLQTETYDLKIHNKFQMREDAEIKKIIMNRDNK